MLRRLRRLARRVARGRQRYGLVRSAMVETGASFPHVRGERCRRPHHGALGTPSRGSPPPRESQSETTFTLQENLRLRPLVGDWGDWGDWGGRRGGTNGRCGRCQVGAGWAGPSAGPTDERACFPRPRPMARTARGAGPRIAPAVVASVRRPRRASTTRVTRRSPENASACRGADGRVTQSRAVARANQGAFVSGPGARGDVVCAARHCLRPRTNNSQPFFFFPLSLLSCL